MTKIEPSKIEKIKIEPMFFIENLHLMYNKTNLIRMNLESDYEDSFEQKQNILKGQGDKNTELYIKQSIEKLKQLFTMSQGGGGMTLAHLKHKIRERIKKIKPRLS